MPGQIRRLNYLLCALFSVTCLSATEEGLGLRRIADFWEEGEYEIAKNQMEEFLVSFPESSHAEILCMALGDLFLREKNYKSALDYYARVRDRDRVFLNRLQCLYHLEWHATLADECEAFLQREDCDPSWRLQATYFLAIALYQQCLNSPEQAVLAERARPYFEILSNSELSDEVAGAFAHLRCMLNDFEGASNIYLKLAEQAGNSEELLFQAALLQSKFDKNTALQTFEQLQGGLFSAEAAYNRLVLYYDLGRFEEIISAKEDWLTTVPFDRIGLAHLFIGQSFSALKDYGKAVEEFSSFLDLSEGSEDVRNGLMQLVEASYKADDLLLLDRAIGRLKGEDSLLPNALFRRALLLKKQGRADAAVAELKLVLEQYGTFPEKSSVIFELCQLEFGAKNWTEARNYALTLLNENLGEELNSFAWNYAAQCSIELGLNEAMEELLSRGSFLGSAEWLEWKLQLAKLEFDLGYFEKSSATLLSLESLSCDGELLLSLCYQKMGDEENFVKWAELALLHGATAVEVSKQHVALFNSYIARNLLEPAANHLYLAFEGKAPLVESNLLWLAQFTFEREEFDKTYAILQQTPTEDAAILLRLAQLHFRFGQEAAAMEILKVLDSNEGKLGFAEGLLKQGADLVKAEALFDEVASSDTLRESCSARAALQSARLKRARGEFESVAVLLKNLTLQRNLANEPVYLEAAIDYIELQQEPIKQLAILKKIKESFEAQDDLLSQDYHLARQTLLEQDKVYLNYMQYLEAQNLILEAELNISEQKELHTKAKAILLQIVSNDNPMLHSRVEQRLLELNNKAN